MNSRDYVKAAIAHRRLDRLPYCVLITSDAWEQLRPTAGTDTAEQFLQNDVACLNPPWWNWDSLAADWAGFDTPATPPHVLGMGSYEDFARRCDELHQQGRYVLATIWGSHFEKAYFSRGIENFLADMAGDPPFARRLLSDIIRRNLVMLENFLTLPTVDGVLLGSDWGSQLDLLMSPDVWQEMIRPGEQAEYDLVHSYGKDVWVHSCGNVEKIIPSLIEMGLDVLNPVQPEAMDIRMLKEQYGSKLTFWGGISTQQTLPYGTADEVRAEARAVRDLLGSDGGYIFSPAQSIQSDVSVENLLALLEVAREPL